MDTTKTINHLSLCAGYGGIDLGLRGIFPTCRTIAYVEIEAFAVANLVNKMEEGELDSAPVWTNLKTLPLEVFRENVSILSGGFPCQPFSQAGKREGDEDPRHLFPFIKNAIRTIQPQWVFLENVEGIISAKLQGDGWEDPAGTPVLLHVLRELERVGHRATAGVFSATEVGAPHQRKRVFILGKKMADPSGIGCEGAEWGREAATQRESNGQASECCHSVAHLGLPWPARPGEPQHEWEEPRVVADADSDRLQKCSVPDEQWAEDHKVGGQTESQLGGTVDGAASGVDATINRNDRLRLLGNGVVPATAALAFRTLYKELSE